MREVEKATVIHLYNTNSSPLWRDLPVRLLDEAEEYVDDEYFAYLGGFCGAKVVILMGQMDYSSGIIAIDEEGQYIDIPKFPMELLEELGVDAENIEDLGDIPPKKLAQMVYCYYQKTQQQ
jgi:hypothetical protein